jgi:DnaK suppressor protein
MEHIDLEQSRKKLLEEKAKILRNLEKVKQEEESSRERQAVGDEVDQAVALEADKLRSALSAIEIQRLRDIDDALRRIEEGTYGYCEECGEPIEEGRLIAKPFAVLCVRCKEEKEREEA